MAGGVINGQNVDEAVTNPAFIIKNADDFTVHKLGLKDPAEGAILYDSAQKGLNTLATTTGATETVPGTTYSGVPSNTITSGDSHQKALTDLAKKFDSSTGHRHSAIAGDGAPIQSSDIAGTPLHGFILQGVDIIGVTGGSSDISTQFSGKNVSTSAVVLGVPTTSPYNKVLLTQASGVNQGDKFVDGSGNEVYARVTNTGGLGGTWTLTYYVLIGGTETAYSFGSASDVRFYYQELFNPLVATPVYSEFAIIPSDNVTADIIQATSLLYGKVILSSVAPGAIASTGSAGTANASVANADHSHEGLHSISKSGSAQILGDATLSAGTGVALTQVGNDISIAATGAGFPVTLFSGTFTNNNTQQQTTVVLSTCKGLIVDYEIQRTGQGARCGRLYVACDGTSIAQTDEGVELNTVGVDLFAGLSGSNITLNTTSTNTGAGGTLKLEIKYMS